jgi:hypothetical protein
MQQPLSCVAFLKGSSGPVFTLEFSSSKLLFPGFLTPHRTGGDSDFAQFILIYGHCIPLPSLFGGHSKSTCETLVHTSTTKVLCSTTPVVNQNILDIFRLKQILWFTLSSSFLKLPSLHPKYVQHKLRRLPRPGHT